MPKLTTCASCGAELAPQSGPGRPTIYCTPECKRLAGFKIRKLVQRIDRGEIDLRELRYDAPTTCDNEERVRRMRALRTWLKADTATLRALLSGETAEAIKSTTEKSAANEGDPSCPNSPQST